MKIYLSGPITGCLPSTAGGWRDYTTERLVEHGFEVRNPLRGEQAMLSKRRKYLEKNYPDTPELSDKAFVDRDRLDVLDCEITFCNLLNAERASIGSICELMLASFSRKLVVIVMEEADNIHNHPFIREAGIIFHDLDQAIDYVLSCAGVVLEEEEKEEEE